MLSLIRQIKIRAMKKYILLLFVLMFSFSVFATSFDEGSQNEKERIEAQLKIYPNPVKNNQVTVALETESFTEIRLISIIGKEIVKEQYDFPLHKATLKLNDVPNGIYIMQIKTEDQQTIAKKLLVSRP